MQVNQIETVTHKFLSNHKLTFACFLFCSYSTEVYYSKGATEQLAWLKEDLAKANKNRDKQPWVIAYGHRPMYCSNVDHDDCTTPKSIIRAQ